MTTADIDVGSLQARLAATEVRLARLEARVATEAVLNQYLYLMDVGYPQELVERVFTTDAVLEVVNFPPGTMQDLYLSGHSEIFPLYDDHTVTAPAIQGGHHTSNLAIEVADDAQSARLSAYFMTSTDAGGSLQGGQYQGEAVPQPDGVWRFRRYRILSGWGWRVDREAITRITETLPAERAWQGARPAERPVL